jgi:hypothetical protein
MSYIIEPWQQHAAKHGDAMIVRHLPVWEQDGWTVRVLTPAGWSDADLGAFPTIHDAEQAARASLGVH